MNWALLQNSLLLAGLTTLLAGGAGFAAALWLTALDRRPRGLFLVVAALAFALPPFLVADCWMRVLSTAGWPIERIVTRIGGDGGWGWNLALVGATAGVLSLQLWPVALFLTLGAWRQIEPAHLESEPALTGRALVRWLLWPMGRGALCQAAAIVFVLALNSFSLPALFQVRVFPAELWVRFTTTFDYAGALGLSLPMILAPLLLILALRGRRVAWPRLDGAVPAPLFRQALGRLGVGFSGALTVGVAALSLGMPLAELLFSSRTWAELGAAARASQGAILNSAWLPAAAATLIVAVSFLTWRWPIGWVAWLPFLIPGVLLGIAMIFLLNRPWLAGLYQGVGVVLLAWTIRFLAVGWHGIAHSVRAIDRELVDAARLEGAGGWSLWRVAVWPQVAPQAMAVWYLTYLLCLWDVETVTLIVPPGGETVSLRVFNLLHYGHHAQVSALCLILLFLAVLPLGLAWAVRTIAARRTPSRLRASRIPSDLPRFGGVAAALALGTLAGCAPSPSNEAPVRSRFFSHVEVIGTRGVGPGQFSKPRSLALDARDNLYVVDMTGRVQKFSPAGEYLAYWQMEQTGLGKPKGMARDAQGDIVVIEPHYARVNHYSPEGRLVARWGGRGTEAGQLVFPRAAAVNSRGEIYVSEYTTVDRVQRFGSRGTNWLGAFGRSGSRPGEFSRAEGLGVDAQDRLYVADSCNHRIQVFDADGRLLRVHGKAGTGPGELSYPYDVRVDGEGRHYVCEFGNSRIQIFGPDDASLEILGGRGVAPGQFSNPWSIALDSQGNLYVADAMNHRVQKFVRKSGTARAPRSGIRHPASETETPSPAVLPRPSA